MRSGRNLTFRQRLDQIHYDGDIPEEYIDQYISHDIMECPIKINGHYIMDHKNFLLHSANKIDSWRGQTKNGAQFYDIQENPILETIAGGHEPLRSIEYLTDLQEDIESWVFLKELEYKIQLSHKAKTDTLSNIEKEIAATTKKINALLDADNNKSPMSPTIVKSIYHYFFSGINNQQDDLSTLLTYLDNLNKAKGKLVLGNAYYDKNVLPYEICQLIKKQERGELSEADQQELALCYQQLDKGNLTRFITRRSHFTFFNRLMPAGEEQHPANLSTFIGRHNQNFSGEF